MDNTGLSNQSRSSFPSFSFHSAIAYKKDTRLEEVVIEPNPSDRGVVIEWLESCSPILSLLDDDEPTMPLESVEKSVGQINEEPKSEVSRKPSKRSSNPTSYTALLIKHRENLMSMKREALNEKPKAYIWTGDWVTSGADQTSHRCAPGRLGARSEFLLKPVPLPKPALTRYPAPTSKDFYQRTKALKQEFANLDQLTKAMRDLFRKLEDLKG
ncbi:hypothetical protein FBUS_02053 [Fasciolopsis buskii]|uniref:Uncharacterized protein n=1 Tax=Fasciolopsis buskii TaxID=27845 RepID=A0A8E0RMS1_9TREM|nr:hypothetical protein FBUS_02053 [Fasciolopsis buski]